jgi:hypothetical protein
MHGRSWSGLSQKAAAVFLAGDYDSIWAFPFFQVVVASINNAATPPVIALRFER